MDAPDFILELGDSRSVLADIEDNFFDSCVTDPPYALVSIANRFGKTSLNDDTQTSDNARKRANVYARASSGFMGQKWDTGEVAHSVEFWREVYRVLKPGAFVLSFAGTRTYHRLACAIEDAGFEIRDMVAWLFGTGFPKSHDVSKQLDKAGGVWRGRSTRALPNQSVAKGVEYERVPKGDAVGDAARQWEGWGTALKPALEPICFARKPLIGTVADNVLAYGTGALNIDACRIVGVKPQVVQGINTRLSSFGVAKRRQLSGDVNEGRWPANVTHDGSDEVVGLFPESEAGFERNATRTTGGIWSSGNGIPCGPQYGDNGSAARFYYSAKASQEERYDNGGHPTVKPVDLMRWLCKLVTQKNGLILDPFAGTGSTGVAALDCGFSFFGIEREEKYYKPALKRLIEHRKRVEFRTRNTQKQSDAAG